MPTNFLTEDQRKRYGRFTEIPDEGQLAGSFLLDQTTRRRAMAAKGPRNRLGWAIQLGTLRYLGTSWTTRKTRPTSSWTMSPSRLGVSPAAFAGYGTAEHRWDHQEQIREAYGYTKFDLDRGRGWVSPQHSRRRNRAVYRCAGVQEYRMPMGTVRVACCCGG